MGKSIEMNYIPLPKDIANNIIPAQHWSKLPRYYHIYELWFSAITLPSCQIQQN